MKTLKQYLFEGKQWNFVEIKTGENPRKLKSHLDLVKEFPESEGWTKVYFSECCHKMTPHGNYQIIVGHLKTGKYAVKYRITSDIVEYPADWKELHEDDFDTLKEAKDYIDNELRKRFENDDEWFKQNYKKSWNNW